MRSFILVLKKIDEAKNAAAIVGTENEDGYTFIFEVPASEQVQTFSIVPFSVKNQNWYTKALKLNVPGMKAPEPTATQSQLQPLSQLPPTANCSSNPGTSPE